MLKQIWKTLDILKTIAFIFILIIGILAILSTSNTEIAYKIPIKPYAVLSDSMEPAINKGSIILVKRGINNFTNNDIITFIRPDNPKENVTHRIIKIEKMDNKTIYKTKGDANKNPDPWEIKPEAIWGKVVLSIPLIGYIISFTKTKLGVILCIALPLAIIILDEIRIIYLEINKIKKRSNEKSKTHSLQTLTALLIGIIFILFSSTPIYADFNDDAQAIDLTIKIGIWNPQTTPTPTTKPVCGGDININIENTGAGSTNNVNITHNCTTTINQTTNTTTNTTIKTETSTGNNNISNTTGNPSITTGSINTNIDTNPN